MGCRISCRHSVLEASTITPIRLECTKYGLCSPQLHDPHVFMPDESLQPLLKAPSNLCKPACLASFCVPYAARSCFVQGKYKMTMGLEPMNPLDWIEIDECYGEELAMRKELVKNNRSTVIHSLPGVRPDTLLSVLLGQVCTGKR